MTVVIHQSSQLIPATQSQWASENELEQVLAGEVSLLQGSADHRLKLVARQVNLPDAGTLDVLCVDENGLPVAVEVKLARNGESRREVVAQIVDYLSALTELTVDELDLLVEGALYEPDKSTIHFLPESKNFTWGCLESREKVFQESPNKNPWHGTPHFAPYVRDTAFKPGRESKSHSESYEPQESCYDGAVSAFAKPRVDKGGERFEVVGRLECRVQFNLRRKISISTR